MYMEDVTFNSVSELITDNISIWTIPVFGSYTQKEIEEATMLYNKKNRVPLSRIMVISILFLMCVLISMGIKAQIKEI